MLLAVVAAGLSWLAFRHLPRQVCPEEGVMVEPCKRGEVLPYLVDMDLECFGSSQKELSDTLVSRLGAASGKAVPLWLAGDKVRTLRKSPCITNVVRDLDCSMCHQLNMSVAPS